MHPPAKCTPPFRPLPPKKIKARFGVGVTLDLGHAPLSTKLKMDLGSEQHLTLAMDLSPPPKLKVVSWVKVTLCNIPPPPLKNSKLDDLPPSFFAYAS